jgi:hypothetical protein
MLMTAVGDVDHCTGGHLVFDELKMVFELANGNTILFPSALLTHWNMMVQPHETQRSIVFWTCGKSIRYYVMGGKLLNSLSQMERKELKELELQDWCDGLQHFLTLEELKAYTFPDNC